MTGIYYALAEQEPPVQIDTVVLLSTAMPQVKKAAQMVRETLGQDKVVVLPLRAAENKPSHDFNDVATALNFIHLANAVLDHASRADGDQVYIGISGGRSSMGALVTLSAYVYGAAGIYHLWVDEKIEKKGDITQLLDMRHSECIKILNPPADQRRLVSIPLAPFDTLWDRGRLGQVLAERPEAREALQRSVTDVDTLQLRTLRQQHETGISSNIYSRLRTTLLHCGPFASDYELRTVFVDARICAWHDSLPQANSSSNRVDGVIDFLYDRHSNTQENALVLLLRVLGDRADPRDACHQHLTKAADELESELKSFNIAEIENAKQPAETFLQRLNAPQHQASFEEIAERVQEIFKGTEIERAIEAAARIYGLHGKDVKLAEVVELAEKLRPYFPPPFWQQVKQDLSDWETLKGGGDRLLKFVETVAAPLTVGGFAALWSIPLK